MFASKTRLFKESIVDSFYNCPMEGPVIVTTLAGPHFDRIAELAYHKLNPIEINSYEINEQTFEKQVFQLQNVVPKYVADISNLFLQDINKCIVSNFMDIDLMGTLLTQGNTIRQLLEQQSYLEGTKVFIGTFALRQSGLNNTLNYIRNFIGLILKSRVFIDSEPNNIISNGRFEYCRTHGTTVKERVESLDVYHYADAEGPMVTFRIIYT